MEQEEMLHILLNRRNHFVLNGMNIGSSGEETSIVGPSDQIDYFAIDEAAADVILRITGDGPCGLTAIWGICRSSPPLTPVIRRKQGGGVKTGEAAGRIRLDLAAAFGSVGSPP